MESRIDIAIKKFSEGHNCAQAVAVTYAPLFGVSEQEVLRTATAFGAGMGRLQSVCGALTGAFMVAGFKEGMMVPGDKESKERTYALVQAMGKAFEQQHGKLTCRELLGCDMNTDEGMKQYHEQGLNAAVCKECVRTAAALVEKMVFEAK